MNPLTLEEALRELVKSIYNDCIGDNTYVEQYKDVIQNLADAIQCETTQARFVMHITREELATFKTLLNALQLQDGENGDDTSLDGYWLAVMAELAELDTP